MSVLHPAVGGAKRNARNVVPCAWAIFAIGALKDRPIVSLLRRLSRFGSLTIDGEQICKPQPFGRHFPLKNASLSVARNSCHVQTMLGVPHVFFRKCHDFSRASSSHRNDASSDECGHSCTFGLSGSTVELLARPKLKSPDTPIVCAASCTESPFVHWALDIAVVPVAGSGGALSLALVCLDAREFNHLRPLDLRFPATFVRHSLSRSRYGTFFSPVNCMDRLNAR